MCQRAGRGWLCHCGALSPKAGLGWPFPPWVAYLKKTKARSFPRQTVAAPFEEVSSRTSPAPQSASLFGFLFARPLHTCHGHQEASSSDTQELPENWGREQVVSFQGRAPLDHPQSQPCLAFQAKENYSSVGVGQDSRPGGPAAPGAWGLGPLHLRAGLGFLSPADPVLPPHVLVLRDQVPGPQSWGVADTGRAAGSSWIDPGHESEPGQTTGPRAALAGCYDAGDVAPQCWGQVLCASARRLGGPWGWRDAWRKVLQTERRRGHGEDKMLSSQRVWARNECLFKMRAVSGAAGKPV